jgi:uncharacterized protein GlcG (DUF336 family)
MTRNSHLAPLGFFILMVAAVQAAHGADAMGTEPGPGRSPAEDLVHVPTLTLEGAKRVAAAATSYARSHGAPGGSIAIVDAGGHTLYLERLDGTFAASADVSVGKARTAVHFQKPTRNLEEAINKGRPALLPVSDVTWFTPLQGGVPIIVNGHVVGGIGVSGALSQQQDEEVAMAGVLALTKTASKTDDPAATARGAR